MRKSQVGASQVLGTSCFLIQMVDTWVFSFYSLHWLDGAHAYSSLCVKYLAYTFKKKQQTCWDSSADCSSRTAELVLIITSCTEISCTGGEGTPVCQPLDELIFLQDFDCFSIVTVNTMYWPERLVVSMASACSCVIHHGGLQSSLMRGRYFPTS